MRDVRFTLDRESPIPLHYQIQGQLREAMERAGNPDGTLLPSEPELAARAAVSRATVRQAIDGLVRAGLLRRQRGRGTFTTTPPPAAGCPGLSDLLDSAYRLGSIGLRSVRDEAQPPTMFAEVPDLPRSAGVTVTRVCASPAMPLVLEHIWVVKGTSAQISRLPLEQPRILRLIARELSLGITRREESLAATPLDQAAARTLETSASELGLLLTRTGFADDTPRMIQHAVIPNRAAALVTLDSR